MSALRAALRAKADKIRTDIWTARVYDEIPIGCALWALGDLALAWADLLGALGGEER